MPELGNSIVGYCDDEDVPFLKLATDVPDILQLYDVIGFLFAL